MRLDGIAWGSLHGTYGTAEDVPRQIAALCSPDSGVRGEAFNELYNAVIHQGTRWQVSAYVIPFIVRLVDDPATRGRDALAELVRDIAVGPRDDRDLPFDPDTAFGKYGGASVTKEQEDLLTHRMYHLEEDIDDDWIDLVNACAEKWEADCYWAAAAHLDRYNIWLDDDEAQVASRAAELLAWFKPVEATVAALLSADRHDEVRASANLALAHMDLPGEVLAGPMTALLDHDSFPVRITAAIALANRMGQGLPDRALDILIHAKEFDPLPDFPDGWHQRAQRGYVALALQRLGLG